MIPLSSNQSTRYTPIVTWLLILINVGVSVYLWTVSDEQQIRNAIVFFGVVPGRIMGGLQQPSADTLPALLTLITAQFLHGGVWHLVGNMLYLKVFGEAVEMRLGGLGFLLFYLASGLVGGIAHIIFASRMASLFIPAIGASGAIAGVLGAYFAMFPGKRVTGLVFVPIPIPLKLPAFLVLGWWFVQDYFSALLAITPYNREILSQGIGYWAHIGGFVVGMIAVLPFLPGIRRREAKAALPPPTLPNYATRELLPKKAAATPTASEFDLEALQQWRKQHAQDNRDLLDQWQPTADKQQ